MPTNIDGVLGYQKKKTNICDQNIGQIEIHDAILCVSVEGTEAQDGAQASTRTIPFKGRVLSLCMPQQEQ